MSLYNLLIVIFKQDLITKIFTLQEIYEIHSNFNKHELPTAVIVNMIIYLVRNKQLITSLESIRSNLSKIYFQIWV